MGHSFDIGQYKAEIYVFIHWAYVCKRQPVPCNAAY